MSRAVPERAARRASASAAVLLLWALVAWTAAPALAEPTPREGADHGYLATGPEVSGGPSLAQAPVLVPGIHLDTFAAGEQAEGEEEVPGTLKHYRIAVQDGQRVHAAATIAAPTSPEGLPEDPEDLGVGLTFLDAAGNTCNGASATDTGQRRTGDGPITSSLVSSVIGEDSCSGPEVFLAVRRTGTTLADSALPVEIQIAIEPAGLDGGTPSVAEPIDDPGAAPLAPAEDTPLDPGRSLSAATEVEPGSYVLQLSPGDVAALRIPVAQGQRLRWRIEVTELPEDAGELSLAAFNPAREVVTVDGGTWRPSAGSRVAGGGMAAPVSPGNRSSDLSSVQSAWLPGMHTVLLQRLQRGAGDDPAGDEPVTLILTVEVEGEASGDRGGEELIELGTTTVPRGPLSGVGIDTGWSGLLLVAAAGMLTLVGLGTGAAGIAVLTRRRR